MKELIRLRIDPELKDLIRRSSITKEISMSNYIRELIRQDQNDTKMNI